MRILCSSAFSLSTFILLICNPKENTNFLTLLASNYTFSCHCVWWQYISTWQACTQVYWAITLFKFTFTFIFCTVAYFHDLPFLLPATPRVPYPSHAALRRPSWSEESLQDVSLSQSNQSVKTNQCQKQDPWYFDPKIRYMTFFSWFLRRSWSSFFSFSSCSTCFAMMKSGSSSSIFCKNKCEKMTSEHS